MVLPIVAYGNSVLREKCIDIEADSPELQTLIDAMWDTMYATNGKGLAASQVDKAIKLFVVDNAQEYEAMSEKDRAEFFDEGDQGIKETFINATILSYSEDVCVDDEGCLSIPTLSERVQRPWSIEIEYLDRDFKKHRKTYTGTTARVVQHEYDHTLGIMYTDKVSPLRKKLLASKLKKITVGDVKASYKLKFA